MKILFALTNPNIADAVGAIIPKSEEATFCYTDSELSKNLNRIGNELDYVIVHESVYEYRYPWEWLSYLKQATSTKTEIIVILSDQTDSLYREIIKRICVDLHVTLIQHVMTGQELAEEIQIRLFQFEEEDKAANGYLVSMMSASPKDGATTIAISTAICLAQRAEDKKILLVDMNLKSPEIRDHLHITSDKGYPLIQADCDSGTLEPRALVKACSHLRGIPNLYILTGIQRREWADKIRVEEIEHLLDVARETFDLIIADVHTYPDQAATLKCMKEADDRLVVVQPIITSYQSSWNDWFNSVWQHYGLLESDFQLILNRDVKAVMEGFQIEKGMGSKIVVRICNVGHGAGIKAVNYGQPLYLNLEDDTGEFRSNILQLATILAEKAKIELIPLLSDNKPTQKRKSWANGLVSIFK